MKAIEILEAALGVNPKRTARPGSRPSRGHEPVQSFTDRQNKVRELHKATGWDISHIELLKPHELDVEHAKHVTEAKRPDRPAPKTDLKVGDRVVADLRKEKDYPGGHQYRSGFVTRIGEKGVHIEPDDQGPHEWHPYKIVKKLGESTDEQFCENCGGSLAEHGKASRALCLGNRPDDELGASNLASCKSQGLRARDGKKSHKLGKSPKSRVKVGGHKIKGKKYGGPLPDWS